MSIGALIEKFRSVGLDRIEKMNLSLLELEQEPTNQTASDDLLREIHTLKGEAKMMGFADVNLVAHQTESLLMRCHELGWALDQEIIDRIFEGFDLIRMLLTKQAGANDRAIDLSEFVDHVQACLRGLEGVTTEPTSGDDADTKARSKDATPSSPRAELPVTPSERVNPAPQPSPPVVVNTPPATSTAPRARSTRATLTTTTDATHDTRAPSGSSGFGVLRIQTENSVRVQFDTLERIGDVASEVLLMNRQLEYHLSELGELKGQLRTWMKRAEVTLPKSHFAALREMTHRFDALSSTLSEDNHLVGVRTLQLDEQVRSLRHISLAQVFSHYPRAIRDLAQAQGKRVRLFQDIGNIQVDRAVLFALSDPLLHLLRNAVDHGVESTSERLAVGKPEEAQIQLSVELAGDSLRVTLRDDGRGIDTEHITQRAIEKGLLSADEGEQLTDQQALALIFEPGFSTKHEVSDISGRGIGMDIVLRQITTMGGVVEVDSEIGQGTTFTLLVPLSSAVIDVLLISIAGQTFALQAKDIERILIKQVPQLINIHGAASVRVDKELLPLADWRPLLLGTPGKLPEEGRLEILVINKGTRKIAVWVDEVLGEREAINRPLGDFLHGLRLCRGVALTEAGEVIPLLNAVELLKRSTSRLKTKHRSPMRQAWSTMELSALKRQRTILVAEDSEVTRSLVSGILRGIGYRVIEAEDGQYALDKLHEHRVDLLMTDIQMPRMGGLKLLETVRADPDFQELPVLVLSTLGSPADKEKAMRLGADGYLVKLDFREKDLISTVRRYLK